jgi:hypothetical protein
VRYEAANTMLLNEFLKQHKKVEEQGATIAEQRAAMKVFMARLEGQEAEIRKVNQWLNQTALLPLQVGNTK